ncbi:conserved protein of unknown function [Ectopseudomonas oleovorans]|uniref:Uncharacterized protein n=1 Tax=Ectopseudomonas oleovorans TaxID=301 RepID=A0A653B7N6_ECTOL|nr:conserved protein of unknown function [Pseudomonas oleovorans]
MLQGRQRAGGAHPRSCLARNPTAGPHPSSVMVQAYGDGPCGLFQATQECPVAKRIR